MCSQSINTTVTQQCNRLANDGSTSLHHDINTSFAQPNVTVTSPSNTPSGSNTTAHYDSTPPNTVTLPNSLFGQLSESHTSNRSLSSHDVQKSSQHQSHLLNQQKPSQSITTHTGTSQSNTPITNSSKTFVISRPRTNKPNNNNNKPNTSIKFKINKDIPELVIYEIENTKSFLLRLKTLLNHDRFLLKIINKDKTALYTESLFDRNIVIKFLDDNGARYFTYTPRSEKPINCLIKYVDSSFDENDVREGLEALGHDLNILNLKIHVPRTDISSNIWLVQLKNDDNKHKVLLGKQYLCSSIVNVEMYKSGALTQCKRCQRYNHSAINCKQEYRCVKCGKTESEVDENNIPVGHPPQGCPLNALRVDGKSDPESLFCCNCKQSGHTANYRKCPKYIELADRQNKKSASQKKKASDMAGDNFNSVIEKGISFADKIKSSTTTSSHKSRNRSRSNNAYRNRSVSSHIAPQTSTGSTNFSFLNTESLKHFGSNITTIISEVNKFIPQYKSTPENQKPIILLEFIIGISSK
jgi:hypothetical protein